MKAIEVRELRKKYKEHVAVNSISFDVQAGEFFAFLGENGAGKSTTINILCTLLEKTGGQVNILGNELGREDSKIRDEIGIVFQNSVLDNKLSVKENLCSRAAYYGLSKKEVLKRLEPFMESFELREIWNQRFERLSGGQKRRVDIVRALINHPKILFLDEPTTGLDPKTRKIVWDYINTLRRQENLTIFLTTHYMEETKECDNVVILDKGNIIATGTPVSLKSTYAKSRLIWYAPKNEMNDRLAQSFEYTYDVDHYNIYFMNNITEFLYYNRNLITDYEIIKGTMDDVFLNLTGKELA